LLRRQAITLQPGGDTACALDGMILRDFAGPKAQILYAEGKPDFFVM
jgi:copper chaperone NosL